MAPPPRKVTKKKADAEGGSSEVPKAKRTRSASNTKEDEASAEEISSEEEDSQAEVPSPKRPVPSPKPSKSSKPSPPPSTPKNNKKREHDNGSSPTSLREAMDDKAITNHVHKVQFTNSQKPLGTKFIIVPHATKTFMTIDCAKYIVKHGFTAITNWKWDKKATEEWLDDVIAVSWKSTKVPRSEVILKAMHDGICKATSLHHAIFRMQDAKGSDTDVAMPTGYPRKTSFTSSIIQLTLQRNVLSSIIGLYNDIDGTLLELPELTARAESQYPLHTRIHALSPFLLGTSDLLKLTSKRDRLGIFLMIMLTCIQPSDTEDNLVNYAAGNINFVDICSAASTGLARVAIEHALLLQPQQQRWWCIDPYPDRILAATAASKSMVTDFPTEFEALEADLRKYIAPLAATAKRSKKAKKALVSCVTDSDDEEIAPF
jgi:hypothetical protein